MRIAVDLDGVCYEWQRTYRYMMREYQGVEMPPVEEFWHYWNAADQFTTKEQRKWMWKEGVRLGLFRYGHMVKGARIGLQKLVKEGHKLEIATHRPVQAVNDTIDWISLYFRDVPLQGVHILSNGESKTSIDCEVLIDDKPENAEQWADTGRTCILFDQPWNQGVSAGVGSGILRATGWTDVIEAVQLVEDINDIRD